MSSAWTRRETAEFLGCTPAGLRALERRGCAPPLFRVGRLVRYRPEVVRRWVEEQNSEAAQTPGARDAKVELRADCIEPPANIDGGCE